MLTPIRNCPRRGFLAFSLVEVVLALGVISFALLAIIGVFPTGQNLNRVSVSDTRAAQVVSALVATIDAQSSTFSSIDCYGTILDLKTLSTSSPAESFYAAFPDPAEPTITNVQTADSIYRVELRFNSDPAVGTPIDAGRLNQIQIRISGLGSARDHVEFFHLARNKG